jgi:hypothetical protein
MITPSVTANLSAKKKGGELKGSEKEKKRNASED